MDIKKIRIPKKISPSPVREAILELRFESSIDSDIMFGILYNQFKEIFKDPPERLPVLNLPLIMRQQDENLKYVPHYQFKNEDYVLRIAPKAISIACHKQYKGWTSYVNFSKSIFGKLPALNIIERLERIGLRYMSFFENINIFENLNIELKMFGENFIQDKTSLRREFSSSSNNFIYIIQTSNNATLKNPDSTSDSEGSLIDLDIIKTHHLNIQTIDDTIETLHQAEKELFFNLLSQDFLKSLKPEY